MSRALRLSVAGVIAMLLCSACVPLPRRTATVVIAERVRANGTPTEVLQQEVTRKRTFYVVAPCGPVLEQWPFRFKYALVNTNGRRQELPFLTKKDVQTDYLVAFPLSDERWIGITTPESNRHDWPAPADLEVFVFKKGNVLFSQTIASSLRTDEYPPEPWPGSGRWKPLTGGDYNSRSVRFEARTGQVFFRTAAGDLLFNPNDGTLRAAP